MLAEVYNVMAALAVVIQLCVVLYSTFTLYIIISSAHNPTAVYRVVLHMVKWIGFFEFMTFIPSFLAVGLVCVAAHLYCKFALSKWFVVGFAVAMAGLFQGAFAYTMSYALPYNAWAWLSLASGWMGFVPSTLARVRAMGQVHGELLLAQAKEGVLGGLDEDDDYVIDAAPTDRARAGEAELSAWLTDVLHLPSTKTALLASAMVAAGLTRERLVEAAGLPGGFQVLVDLLAAQTGDTGPVGLRPGDRLALAAAAMRAVPVEAVRSPIG